MHFWKLISFTVLVLGTILPNKLNGKPISETWAVRFSKRRARLYRARRLEAVSTTTGVKYSTKSNGTRRV